eukprot:362405-Chlamydomonas_euryale.AAC.3
MGRCSEAWSPGWWEVWGSQRRRAQDDRCARVILDLGRGGGARRARGRQRRRGERTALRTARVM